MNHSQPISVVAVFALSATLFANQVAVFRGSPSAPGDVVQVDLASPSGAHVVAGLAQITLLPLDFVGRTTLDELSPRFPRRRADVPNAARLALQQGRGSLYHYVANEVAGARFGWFIVDANGSARILFELVEPVGSADPFVARIAVTPSGDALLAATNLAAGGDLFEIDVATGVAKNRTSTLPPLDFGSAGLAIGATFGAGIHSGGVLRFDRATNSDAQALSLPGTPTWFSREMATSSNGSFAITTAGTDAAHANAYSFGASGAALVVSTTPSFLSGAGFEPDAQDGPYLAISDDGSCVAWRGDGVKRETFMAHTLPPAGEAPQQLTSDANFLDTLDEVGLYGFRPGSNKLLFGVGKQATPGANVLDTVDMFSADLVSGGAPILTNVTLSSGDSIVPFLSPPTIKPLELRWIDSANEWFLLDQSQDRWITANANSTGVQVQLSGVKSLDLVEHVGGQVIVALQRSQPTKSEELWRIDELSGSPASLIASFGAGDVIDRSALRSDGLFAFVQTTANAEFVWLWATATSQWKSLTSRPLHYGPALAFAPGGQLMFGVGALGAQTLFGYWTPFGAAKRLPLSPPSPGFVLPGA